MEILKTKEECDHVQFLITETSTSGRVCAPEMAEIETLSLGKLPTYFMMAFWQNFLNLFIPMVKNASTYSEIVVFSNKQKIFYSNMDLLKMILRAEACHFFFGQKLPSIVHLSLTSFQVL